MVGRPDAAPSPNVEMAPASVVAMPAAYVQPSAPSPKPAATLTPPTARPLSRVRLPTLSFNWLRPLSNGVWRYVSIGIVVVAAGAYLISQFSRHSEQPPAMPKPDETPVRSDSNQGNGTQGAETASDTGAPAVGTPTDTSGLNSDVSNVVQKAEAADRSARARALLAREQLRLASAASARARQGDGSSVGLLNGHDASGNNFAFAGEIADGTEQGVGAAAISNGNHYSGQWFAGSAQGLGVFTYANGDQYSGEFNESAESGLGSVTFTDHSKGLGYSGQWAANAYNGYGVYYFQNGTRLEGLWHAGQVNGLGARFDARGKLLEQGTYVNSVLKH